MNNEEDLAHIEDCLAAGEAPADPYFEQQWIAYLDHLRTLAPPSRMPSWREWETRVL